MRVQDEKGQVPLVLKYDDVIEVMKNNAEELMAAN